MKSTMEHSLHYNLLAAHTLFQKRFLARLRQEYPALLPGQPKVIDYLMSHPDSFQREIADGCLIDPATLSPILGKMEDSGLIRRDKTDDNRKNSIVFLTARGKEVGRRLRELFQETERISCDGVSGQQVELLLQCLEQIRKNCGNTMQ
mgnify:CR=1 FL=1